MKSGRRPHHRAPTSRPTGPAVRVPLRGTYRGYDVLAMPPVSSGGMRPHARC